MLFLSGIGIKTAKKEPLTAVNNSRVTFRNGLEGDVRGKGGLRRLRQVTIISANQWREVCSDMGWNPFATSWMLRRAGLCIEGLWFTPAHIGQYILIGERVILRITGETTPCEKVMDAIAPGLAAVLRPLMRGGVTCKVIRGGKIATGNNVVISVKRPQ